MLMKWYFGGIDFLKSLDISEEDKSLILGGNAMRLFNLAA
jgi:predicted TIM-barrel fold metal-dependent hydrolase